MLKNYKHIIWDWNGTVLNDLDLCVDVANNLFSKKNVPTLTVEKYKSIFTLPVKNYYIAAGFDFEKESFEVVGKEWMDEYEERKYECQLHEGLIDVLEKIKFLGIEQSLLSAYKQDNLREMADKFNLTKYFSNIVGLDNIYAASKVELGKELMKTIGNGHGEALMIGDTTHDFEVANEIGADCILVAGGHQNLDTLNKTGVKVYNTIRELLGAI
ncbi:MAG: HAD family hydrolase [Ignavibacteriae bacterium]|nr:HAD family hydrolase [Ignavibacteriota bacterium]MCB0746392.1 HAD family hydrolase [Ignavibacteriota bacterium]